MHDEIEEAKGYVPHDAPVHTTTVVSPLQWDVPVEAQRRVPAQPNEIAIRQEVSRSRWSGGR